MQEREINLIDLLIEILLRWRMMIVWMIVGGILLGAFSYVRSIQSAVTQKSELEQQNDLQAKLITLEEVEETLTAAQINSVRTVLNNDKYNEYFNQSVLMQIDATNVPRMKLSFLITAEDADKCYSIERIYEDLLSCGLYQWVADRDQTDKVSTNLKELITVNGSQRDFSESNVAIISIAIVHVTEEECRELSRQVIEYLEEQHEQLVRQLGTHDMELLGQSFANVTDIDLLNRQKTMLNNIASGNINAEKLQKDFTAEQQKYYLLLKKADTENGEENNTEQNNTEQIPTVSVSSPSVSVRYIFLGMVLFAFIYMVYRLLKYILSNKLRATDDIRQIYNLTQLGMIPRETSKKRAFSFVDGWILKLRDYNKRIFSRKEATGLAAVAVKMQAKKEGLDAVYCIGSDLKEDALQVAEQMQTMLKEDDITINILNNVLYNQESMEQLQGAKAVFLLEKVGETLYDEIAQELELLQRQDIRVLGAVVVE